MNTIKFGTIEVGPDRPPYIIAEIGSNHNGDMKLCRQLIGAAAEAGAHAVKFQSWSETSLIAEEEYARNTDYSDKKKHFGTLREMVRSNIVKLTNIVLIKVSHSVPLPFRRKKSTWWQS